MWPYLRWKNNKTEGNGRRAGHRNVHITRFSIKVAQLLKKRGSVKQNVSGKYLCSTTSRYVFCGPVESERRTNSRSHRNWVKLGFKRRSWSLRRLPSRNVWRTHRQTYLKERTIRSWSFSFSPIFSELRYRCWMLPAPLKCGSLLEIARIPRL